VSANDRILKKKPGQLQASYMQDVHNLMPENRGASQAADGYIRTMEPDLTLDLSLRPLLDELRALEDSYHAACASASPEAFDRLVAPDFWEIGASGRRMSRAFARQVLAQRPGTPEPSMWQTDEHHLQAVGEGMWLLTYRLMQPGRTTRRMTLWRREGQAWQAVFHQGTPVIA
jgi:hypothetical protein